MSVLPQLRFLLTTALLCLTSLASLASTAIAAEVRDRAVVRLRLDEPSGTPTDSATAGKAPDAVALPAAAAAQVHPFLVALVALVSTQVWFLPYQSTVYLALHHGSGECFSHAHARALAWLWGGLVLVAIALSMPVWRLMGLVGA